MLVKELLKKHNLNIKLDYKLLDLDVGDGYNNYTKKKVLLDDYSTGSLVKREFESYVFKGDVVECIITPTNKFRTLTYHMQMDKYVKGYGYSSDGKLTFII